MNRTVNALREKIENGSAVVGVIGMGYVGLPLARAFWQAGFRVIGFEVDPKKVEQLNAGQRLPRPHAGRIKPHRPPSGFEGLRIDFRWGRAAGAGHLAENIG